MTEKRKRQANNRRKRLIEYAHQFKSKCVICGENRQVCLDYHHEHDKEFNIMEMARKGKGYDKIKDEIDKCIVVCANCHRVIHTRSA